MALREFARVVVFCFLTFFFSLPADAAPDVTVISQGVENAYGEMPEVDGLTDLELQEKVNGLLRGALRELQGKMAGRTELNYSFKVARNTSEFLSIMLKADSQGVLQAARGVNIHLPTGSPFSMRELFTATEEFFAALEAKLGWRPTVDTPFTLSARGVCFLAPAGGLEQVVGYEHIFPFLLAGPAVYYMDHYRLTAAADGKLVRAGVGELLVVFLEANRSAGYAWQTRVGGHPVLHMVGAGHILNSVKTAAAGGWDMLIFGVAAPGETRIELDYKRFWEKQASRTIKIQVIGE